jgi:uncharacterized protein (TIGR03437 family)
LSLSRREILILPFATNLIAQQIDWQSALVRYRGVRPRLFMDKARLSEILSSLNTSFKDVWDLIKRDAEVFRSIAPPVYISPTPGTDDQFWQRSNGDRMFLLGLGYLLSGDSTLLAACKRWALASCSYPTWGTGDRLNADLAAAHQLSGLATVYDWLFDSLDSDTLATIRKTVLERAPYIYAAAQTGRLSRLSLQGHKDIPVSALAMAGFAMFDDATGAAQALQWLDLCRSKMRDTDAILSPDGGSQEGVNYADYQNQYLLEYWDQAGRLLGEKPTSTYFDNAAWYRIYLTVPRNAWVESGPMQMDVADCDRIVTVGPGAHVQRFSALSRIPQGQWYAAELRREDIEKRLGWLNVAWFDPTLLPVGPAGLPTLRHFDNLGIVAARSSWAGDESLLVFKSGAPLGKLAQSKIKTDELDAGHAHPDANHLMLFGSGEMLLRDDGFLTVKKSENHNTLLVQGAGQMGEGGQWLDIKPYLSASNFPSIVTAQSQVGFDYIVGEAAPSYSASQGVRKFRRHVIFIKPSALVVFDDIELERAAPMELRFHTEAKPESLATNVFVARGKQSVLSAEVLTPDLVDVSTGSAAVMDSSNNAINLTSIRLKRTASAWRNVTAFSWSAAAGTPPQVRVTPSSAGFSVDYDGRRLSFQWDGTIPSEVGPVPVIRSAQPVAPAFGGVSSIGYSANGYVEIYGENLASKSRTWSGEDFNGTTAPTSLDGTQVRVNGRDAFVYFVSPAQININLPDDLTVGPVELQVVRNRIPSNIVTINRANIAPAILTTPAFRVNGRQYGVALLPQSTQNGPFVGAPGLIQGASFVTVKPGDRIVLYVLGAGPTNPATRAGVASAGNAVVATPYELRIGGVRATVEFFGITAGSIGLYQINALIPQVPARDQSLELVVGGVATQQGLYLSGISG